MDPNVDGKPLERFVATFAISVVVALVFGAVASPPEPFSQFAYAAPAVVVSFPLVYWLVYRDGYRHLRGMI